MPRRIFKSLLFIGGISVASGQSVRVYLQPLHELFACRFALAENRPNWPVFLYAGDLKLANQACEPDLGFTQRALAKSTGC